MMSYWENLDATVQSALDSGRIGTPVFARWTVSLNPAECAGNGARHITAHLTRLVGGWFSAQPTRLYALSSDDFHTTLAVDYPSGAAAVISAAVCGRHSHIDLNLLGSHGSIVQKEFLEPHRDGSLAVPQTHSLLYTAIDRSRSSGEAVAYAGGGLS